MSRELQNILLAVGLMFVFGLGVVTLLRGVFWLAGWYE
jgi:hypothetical protein